MHTKILSKNFLSKIAIILVLLIIFIIIGIFCFMNLADAGIANWDEARHIINAFEMMKSKNWWINTYRYDVDYFNYKPPLSMWSIILAFKFFGISVQSARLFSAISMFLLVTSSFIFIYKKIGKMEAVIYGVLLASNTDLFFFHMARSADADSVYLFMLVLGIICLYQAEEKPWFLTGCGFFASMAFLAKCWHVAILFGIGICYLPRLANKLKFKHYLTAGLAFILPIGIWGLIRYQYDGILFLRGMFSQEVMSRVSRNTDYLGYFKYFFSNPIILIGCIFTIIACVLKLLANTNKRITKQTIAQIISHKSYLFILWLIIPFIVYSASGAFMEWYCYVCFFPLYCLFAMAICYLERNTKKATKYIWIVSTIVLFLFAGQSIYKSMHRLTILRYENNTYFRNDIVNLLAQYPEYAGCDIYIENENNEYKPQNEWEQNLIADAYIAGSLNPMDGGVPLFIENQNAILAISKNLFPNYSTTLSGRVILVDGNDYLIFSNDFYQ